MMDENVSYYFNALLADVEWQNDVTAEERELNLMWAQAVVLRAARDGSDLAKAYMLARETLRYYSNRVRADRAAAGDTFVLHRGDQTVLMAK